MSTGDFFYIDRMKPINPMMGEIWTDKVSRQMYMWDGVWNRISTSYQSIETLIPTEAQMEKYPALKEAWEEYLITKKLVGV